MRQCPAAVIPKLVCKTLEDDVPLNDTQFKLIFRQMKKRPGKLYMLRSSIYKPLSNKLNAHNK